MIFNKDELIPEAVGHTWFGLSKEVIVRNADPVNIRLKKVIPLSNQLFESNRAWFFHSFEAEFDINRNLRVCILETLDDIDPAKDGSLIVRASSAVHFSIFFGEHERIGIPAVGSKSGLDI